MVDAAQKKDVQRVVPLDIEALQAVRNAGDAYEIIVPEIWTQPERYNQLSLVIHDTLMQAHREECRVLKEAGQSEYASITAVLFHELLTLYCRRSFAALELADCQTQQAEPLRRAEVLADVVGTQPPLRALVSRVRNHVRKFKTNAYTRGSQYVMLAGNIACDRAVLQREHEELMGSSGHALIHDDRRALQMYVPCLSEQRNIVFAAIDQLTQLVQHDFQILLDGAGLRNAVEQMIHQHCTAEPVEHPVMQAGLLVSGSQCRIHERKLIAVAKAAQVPVIMLWHGASFGALDEPIFNYGERAYCDAVVGFGNAQAYVQREDRYARLYDDDVTYAFGTHARVHASVTSGCIPRLGELSNPRVAYVPTSFSGIYRYGPFRDLPDVAYLRWQEDLLRALHARYPGQVLWKRHRKERHANLMSSDLPVRIDDQREVYDLHDAIDVFVFDYMSTALAVAAATDKPIIYLDIGLRSWTPEAFAAIRQRCLYVDARGLSVAALERAWPQLDVQDCVDHFTEQFTLSSDRRSVEQVLARSMSAIVEGK